MAWHALEKEDVFRNLKSSEAGLDEREAKERLKKYGLNELRQTKKISSWVIFLEQFRSVFILILFLAAIFSIFIQHYIDFIVIVIIISINSLIGFLQQYKAEKTIFELKEFLVPKVRVLRDNKINEVDSTKIVPGDVIFISEGDKIMADCRVFHSDNLETNEAILTGESFPQKKSSEKIELDTEIADRNNMIYMGTTVVKGSCKAIVISTNMNTEFGKIAKLVQQQVTQRTPFEKKFDLFSKKIAIVVLVLAVITSLIGILRGEEIFAMILAAISLAVAVIPEGLPAVMAITLALAIARMKKQNALIRKLSAAETLGRATVICVDKTGTLTEEQMTVTKLFCDNRYIAIKEKDFFDNKKRIFPNEIKELKELLKIGIMCNNARFEEKGIFGDPTEKALIVSAKNANLIKKFETEKEKRIKEFSFSSKRKLMSIVRFNGKGYTSYVKGAPEILIKNCSKELVGGRVVNLNLERKKELTSYYENMSEEALRVLGFAYKNLNKTFSQEEAETELIFVGFQGILDPPRKEVKGAISECLSAGIKIKMITGDSLKTAEVISEMIGLDGRSIEAKELEKLSEKDFDNAIRNNNIFARITPELKLKIVQSLKKHKEIVAVTGDGVNDILALKEANIGVAMGIRGTDVARDVSDVILLDDNFHSIVKAVREGRRVYDNLRKSIKFHLAANIHELFLVLFALALAMPLPMIPIAILWINLITDSLPSLALSVEKEEKDIMKRKPIDHEEDILKGITRFIILAGIISFIVSISLFFIYFQISSIEKARTIATTSCVLSELFLIYTCRTERKNVTEIGIFSNKFLNYSVLIAFILQMIAVYTPLAEIFSFVPLTIPELLLVIITSASAFIFFETEKYINNKFT